MQIFSAQSVANSANSSGKGADGNGMIQFIASYFIVCQCNQTLNLLSRPEYFRLETNIDDDQLILSNLFTPPHTFTLIRSRADVPTLTFSLTKGPVDLMSIGTGNPSDRFNAYITMDSASGDGTTITIGPIQSKSGVVEQCLPRVDAIKLEFFDLAVSNSKQNVQLDLRACEYTLRKLHLEKNPGVYRFIPHVACNCTPIYNVMQDSTYLDRIEISEPSEQLSTLRGMILRNNRTGFQFSPASAARFLRVIFKNPIPIALVQVLTPRSNVTQIRLSYFDDNNQTIKDSTLKGWQVNHISELGRANNSIDKLCPNFLFRGIRVDILQTDPSSVSTSNVTLHVYIRNCNGMGGRIRKCERSRENYDCIVSGILALCDETNIMPNANNLATYKFISQECLTDATQAFENLRGANCDLPNPEVLIKFKQSSRAYVSKVEVQRESDKYPGNVRQIEVVFYDANDSLVLDEVSGEPARWKSPENKPIIVGDFKDVRGLALKVLKTDNGSNVRRLRIKVTGCYSAGS